MYYRSLDFRLNALVYSAILTAGAYEGPALIRSDSTLKIMQVGLISIASVGICIALIELAVIQRLSSSILEIHEEFDRVPVLYTSLATVGHLVFYKLMTDKGLPINQGEPILTYYVSYCFLLTTLFISYNLLRNADFKRFGR